MSLKSTKRDERVFYFKEKPSDINYPYPECFYFKIVEYRIDEESNTLEYVVIQKVNLVFIDKKEKYLLKFSDPHIPNSIEKSVREMEILKNEY